MFTLTATILAVQAVSAAGLFLMSRYSVQLVDEQGRPMERNGDWHEQVVPAVTSRVEA